MTWETDGMMRCLKDGQEIWRAIDYVEVLDERDLRGRQHGYNRPVPIMSESEEVRWMVGDDRPHIQVRGGL